MTFYYLHPESGSAFLSQDNPELVISRSDGCVELTDRAGYERACKEFYLTPEPHPDPCLETQLRIRVAVYAWAYEVHDDPLVSDAVFDHTARRIYLDRSTSRPYLDEWFRNNFNPSTGMWVRSHPEPEGLERIYQMLRRGAVNALHVWLVAA